MEAIAITAFVQYPLRCRAPDQVVASFSPGSHHIFAELQSYVLLPCIR
jgi:hypothetical protein